MTARKFLSAILLLAFSRQAAAGDRARGPLEWDRGPDLLRQIKAPLLKAPGSPQGTSRTAATAQDRPQGPAGLMIDATEIGVGKFHRYDNQVHPYPADSVWRPHISPGGSLEGTPIIFESAGGFITIQFSHLEELLRSIAAVSRAKGAKVSVLNIHGHGLPGGMWYPKDATQRDGGECSEWRTSASAPDRVNYEQYYSPISKREVMEIRAMSYSTGGHYACVTGAREWSEIAARVPEIRSALAPDVQIHFQSCVVGLGEAGRNFSETLSRLLLSGERAAIQTSTNFGLGDWSMPEGMGFWDYLDEEQIARDNRAYSEDRTDREIRQKGTIRLSVFENGAWSTTLVAGQDFMSAGRAPLGPGAGAPLSGKPRRPGRARVALSLPPAPSGSVRIPGTRFHTRRLN